MSTQTANLKLSLYEPDDAANLCDGYNDSMNKIDTYAHSNDANITTIDATLSSHTDKINTNATNISQEVTRAKLAEDTLSGTINTLSTNVTKNSTDIASLESSVSTDGTKITNLETANATNATNITTNTNNIASLTTKTNQNTTDIATNKTNIASNSSAITKEISDRTTAITKEISDRTTADAALQSKIDNLAPKSAVIYKYDIANLPGLANGAITGEANSNGYLIYDATYKILYFNLNFYFGDAGVTGSAYQLFTLPTTIPKPTQKVFPVSYRRGNTGVVNSNSVRINPSGVVDCGNMSGVGSGTTDLWIVGALPWGVFSTSA